MKLALQLLFLFFILINVFFKGKPAISLFLFISDLIKMDKRVFRGYGFWLFCGLGGSGKTLSMVEYMSRMKFRYPKLKIYTNFDFKLSDGFIKSWKDIVEVENYELKLISEALYLKLDDYNRFKENDKFYQKVHNGIIFGFDEIHLTFASQNWQSCPDNMLDYISQQRKLHKQIVASSQVFTRVDKKLREQTNFVIECKSLFMGRWIFNKYFHSSDYLSNDEKLDSGARKRKRSKRYNFIAYDKIRNLYNTYQLMKNLTPKTQQQILIDKLKNNLS